MKKSYITPETMVIVMAMSQMLAASRFTTGSDTQDIILTDEEFDGEFGVKEYFPEW